MPTVVSLLDKVFDIKNAVYRDKWHGPEARQDKVPLMQMSEVAKALPRNIPVARVPTPRIAAPLEQKTLELLRRYLSSGQRRFRVEPAALSQRRVAEIDACFQDGLRSSMAMLLRKPTARETETNPGLESVPNEFVLDLNYHGVQTRPEVEPLECVAHLSRRSATSTDAAPQKRADPENDLILMKIAYQGRVYTRSDPEFARISNIVLTSLLTTGTIQHHFLYSHVLTGGAIYSTAAHHLSKMHPVYLFVHPHGYEVATGNVYKAKILVTQSLVSDWSFDEPALQLLMNKWTEDFRLADLLPPSAMSRAGFTPKTVHACPSLDRAWKLWLAFERYATEWVDVTYGVNGAAAERTVADDKSLHAPHVTEPITRTEERIAADKELAAWYAHLASLPSGIVPGPTLNRQNLIALLASYVYVCVFYHQVFGDEQKTRELVQRADLIVPRAQTAASTNGESQRFISKQIFHVIFQSVIEKRESFADPKWPKSLPGAYQRLVEDLQKQVKAISPERWEIGINK